MSTVSPSYSPPKKAVSRKKLSNSRDCLRSEGAVPSAGFVSSMFSDDAAAETETAETETEKHEQQQAALAAAREKARLRNKIAGKTCLRLYNQAKGRIGCDKITDNAAREKARLRKKIAGKTRLRLYNQAKGRIGWNKITDNMNHEEEVEIVPRHLHRGIEAHVYLYNTNTQKQTEGKKRREDNAIAISKANEIPNFDEWPKLPMNRPIHCIAEV